MHFFFTHLTRGAVCALFVSALLAGACSRSPEARAKKAMQQAEQAMSRKQYRQAALYQSARLEAALPGGSEQAENLEALSLAGRLWQARGDAPGFVFWLAAYAAANPTAAAETSLIKKSVDPHPIPLWWILPDISASTST